MFSSTEHFRVLRRNRMLTAITRRWAAFAASKVAQIVALGLLYALIPVNKFSIFLAKPLTGEHGQSEQKIEFEWRQKNPNL